MNEYVYRANLPTTVVRLLLAIIGTAPHAVNAREDMTCVLTGFAEHAGRLAGVPDTSRFLKPHLVFLAHLYRIQVLDEQREPADMGLLPKKA
jgi:hypothetical protein